jgi:3-deoxy-D-manno-octulosonic-acid transferase
LYTLATIGLTPLLLLRWLWRNKSKQDLWVACKQKLGFVPWRLSKSNPIWIHAVSVGEVKAISPLVKKILEDYPQISILVTTTTVTGAEIANLEFGARVSHFYFPIDLPSVLSRFLSRVNPKVLILVETELWPNLLKMCNAKRIPACIVNGRMSPTSYKNYLKAGVITAPAFETLSIVLAQTEEYAEWYQKLGVNPSSISIVGNLKFDIQIGEQSFFRARELRERLGLTSKKVMCFGSFRKGEEPFIIETMINLRVLIPEVVFILAPRHLENISFVAKLVVSSGFSLSYQSTVRPKEFFDVLVVDTLGHLLSFYAVSDVAFVGGSMLPYGGQNVLEPIAVKVPAITGAFTFNFGEICEELLAREALVKVSNSFQLCRTAEILLASRELALAQSSRATEVMENSKGATKLTLEALKPFVC